jgi:deoxyribodipyrimidine photolyase
MPPRIDAALVWFRRDLRSYDHAALYHALARARRVYCAFVFDTEILDALETRADRRVEFICARDEIPALAARPGRRGPGAARLQGPGDAIPFGNDEGRLRAWCEGSTGYPLVDAAMRQLNQTGYMHNRLRMLTASFLVKDLQVDWRRGERYFARQLNDYDLAANNGGWQRAAFTGCDAQPYFRIFNPVTQSRRFDAQRRFIRLYLPELARMPERFIHAPWTMSEAEQAQAGVRIGRDYPAPIVDHAQARKLTLEVYGRLRDSR